MMGIKCSSCGSPQNINSQLICSYCGSQLNINNESSETDVKYFELAIYKYNSEEYEEAYILFNDILSNNPAVFSAWVYMIFSKGLKKELKKETDTIINLKRKDIDLIINKVNSINDIELIENLLLRNYEKKCDLQIIGDVVFLTTPLLDETLSSYKRMASYKIEKKREFVENLLYLSEKFSDAFCSKIITHLIYSIDFPLKCKEWTLKSSFSFLVSDYLIPIERIISLAPILKKDIENSELLISKIIDLNNNILNFALNFIDEKIEYYLNHKYLTLSEHTIQNYTENIKTLSDNINLSNLIFDQLQKTSLSFNGKILHNSSTNLSKNSIDEITLKFEKLKKISSKEENSKKCFIATAAMGDYNHPVVVDLRSFRDDWLLKQIWGVSFINWYYTHGPKAAIIIENSYLLRKITFLFLIKPLQIITKKLK
jgi:tetratricopeptide (TPR) repeat protein